MAELIPTPTETSPTPETEAARIHRHFIAY